MEDLELTFAVMNICCDTSDTEIVCGVCGVSYCESCAVSPCEICVVTSCNHNLCPRCGTVAYEFDTTICYHHLRELVSMLSTTTPDEQHVQLCSRFGGPEVVVRDLLTKYPGAWEK